LEETHLDSQVSFALSHSYAFLRISDTLTINPSKPGDRTTALTLPPGMNVLENSADIVSLAFDERLTELTQLERDRGLQISDVIKLVKLSATLRPMREVLRLESKSKAVLLARGIQVEVG
jgi:hypothetical protein